MTTNPNEKETGGQPSETVPEAEAAEEKNGATPMKEDETVNAEQKSEEKGSESEKDAEIASKLLADALAENDTLKKELAEQKDQHLRTLAEYDNFRKRTAGEKSAIYSDTAADVVKQFLPVLDNLERAADCTADSAADSAVRAGVELVLKSFRETLEKLGVSEIEALGKSFDPNFHHAVMREDDPEKEEGEITAVFQKGYKIGSKIIRYAMVKVAN